MQVLVKKLEEYPGVQEIRVSHAPTQRTTQVDQLTADRTPNMPSFILPMQQPQPNYSAVDINELSAGLGLPAMKVDANDDASPAASNKSRFSQTHPGALYGKLIGWALDKPLTAKGLAEYLQNQDLHTSSGSLSPVSVSPTKAVAHQDTEAASLFPGARPTQNLGSVPDKSCPAIPAPIETTTPPKGTPRYQHQHRRSLNSSTPFRQHAHNSSNRRYLRRTSRSKRMDQGPMPSAADIYPDDANWTPSAPIYEGFDYIAYSEQSFKQSQVIIDNAFNWPTPAQVYKPESAPTTADIDAVDNDVFALMCELPMPSLGTLSSLGTLCGSNIAAGLELPCDPRPLTPAQLDGSRYGMKFYGIALGDEWELPKVGDFGESETFRVRPREHNGWGGWEWALKQSRSA